MENNSNAGNNQITSLRHAMNNEEQSQHSESPLPSNGKRLTQEELQNRINKYTRRIKVYEDSRRAKKKQKVQSRRNISNIEKELLDQMLMMQKYCNAKGFMFGIVTETGESVTGVSDCLKEWMRTEVMFDKTAPAGIEKYHKERSLFKNLYGENEAKSSNELLMEQSNPTPDA